jgi:single-strand DNA-binding protein
VNVVVLQGTLSSDPVERALASGSSLTSYEVTTRPTEGKASTVPVVWFDGGRHAAGFATGDEVVVVGQVHRRFFAAGGTTQSRTEVVATVVVRPTQRRRVGRAIATAWSEVEAVAGADAG